jgi:hypothetical protein
VSCRARHRDRSIDRRADRRGAPFVAIDGGFYDVNGAPMGLVRAGGRDVARSEKRRIGVLVIERGAPRIVQRDEYRASDEISDAVQSIDRASSSAAAASGASVRATSCAERARDRRTGTIHFVVAFDDRAVGEEEDARIALDEDSARAPRSARWQSCHRSRRARRARPRRRLLHVATVKKRAACCIEAHRATINAIIASAPR